MEFKNEDIMHLAKLSKLEFSENEIESFKSELNKITCFVEKIQSVELHELGKTVKIISEENLREDEIKEGLTQEEVLMNAPEKKNGAFKVPKVVG